jgi:nucleoside-diphosphate-sugar epimerase
MSADVSHAATQPRQIVILGAGGYLGSSLCYVFHALGQDRVVAVSRRTPNHRHFASYLVADVFAEDWAQHIADDLPLLLINCAFDFGAVSVERLERKYAVLERNLSALAGRGGARLINISTASAYRGCRTDYGQEKLYVEDIFSKYGGLSVRPGLVVSWRRPGAGFLKLIDTVRGSKLIPLLVARNSGFPTCDLEAFLLGVVVLASMRINKPHTLTFCYGTRLKLATALQMIERRQGVSRLKFPVPWLFAYVALRMKEALIGKSKIRADSVLDFAFPMTRPDGRDAFVRLIGHFGAELKALPDASGMDNGAYFLETTAHASSKICHLRKRFEPRIFEVLGGLPDA